jgi:hypothetical protein
LILNALPPCRIVEVGRVAPPHPDANRAAQADA